eukprot:7452202-Pyramimonas_sp.AAC.1
MVYHRMPSEFSPTPPKLSALRYTIVTPRTLRGPRVLHNHYTPPKLSAASRRDSGQKQGWPILLRLYITRLRSTTCCA